MTQKNKLALACLSFPFLFPICIYKTSPAQASAGFQHLCSNTGSHHVSSRLKQSDPRSMRTRGKVPLRPHWRRIYLSFLKYRTLDIPNAPWLSLLTFYSLVIFTNLAKQLLNQFTFLGSSTFLTPKVPILTEHSTQLCDYP